MYLCWSAALFDPSLSGEKFDGSKNVTHSTILCDISQMESIYLLQDNLKKSRDHVFKGVEEMREHCMVFPTPNGDGHTLWVLGHLAYIEGLVIHSFMLVDANSLADWEEIFGGADTSGDPSHYPPFDQVLAKCRQMRESTLALLDSFTEDDLDRPSANTPKGCW